MDITRDAKRIAGANAMELYFIVLHHHHSNEIINKRKFICIHTFCEDDDANDNSYDNDNGNGAHTQRWQRDDDNNDETKSVWQMNWWWLWSIQWMNSIIMTMENNVHHILCENTSARVQSHCRCLKVPIVLHLLAIFIYNYRSGCCDFRPHNAHRIINVYINSIRRMYK